jgi:hypothetical protein
MVVKDKIPLSEVPQLTGNTLVGRFNDKYLGEKTFIGWMNNPWKPLIGSSLKVHLMSRNWISFLSVDYCEEIQK